MAKDPADCTRHAMDCLKGVPGLVRCNCDDCNPVECVQYEFNPSDDHYDEYEDALQKMHMRTPEYWSQLCDDLTVLAKPSYKSASEQVRVNHPQDVISGVIS